MLSRAPRACLALAEAHRAAAGENDAKAPVEPQWLRGPQETQFARQQSSRRAESEAKRHGVV